MSKLSTEVLERINRSLEKHDGDRHAAADELGWSYATLAAKIHENESLKLRWTKEGHAQTVTPPSEVACLSRPGEFTDKQQKELDRVLREEDKKILRNGLASIGLNSKEQQIALELQAFNRDNFSNAIDIISAGVTRMAMKLQTQADAIATRLEYVREQITLIHGMSEDREKWVLEEKGLMEDFNAIADECRKMMGTGFDAAKVTAYIKSKMSGTGRKAKTVPGFSPVGAAEIEV